MSLELATIRISHVCWEDGFVFVHYKDSTNPRHGFSWKAPIEGRIELVPVSLVVLEFLLDSVPIWACRTDGNLRIESQVPFPKGMIDLFEFIHDFDSPKAFRLDFNISDTTYYAGMPKIAEQCHISHGESQIVIAGNSATDANSKLIWFIFNSIIRAITSESVCVEVPVPGYLFWHTVGPRRRYLNAWPASEEFLLSLQRAIFGVFGCRVSIINPCFDGREYRGPIPVFREHGIAAYLSDKPDVFLDFVNIYESGREVVGLRSDPDLNINLMGQLNDLKIANEPIRRSIIPMLPRGCELLVGSLLKEFDDGYVDFSGDYSEVLGAEFWTPRGYARHGSGNTIMRQWGYVFDNA